MLRFAYQSNRGGRWMNCLPLTATAERGLPIKATDDAAAVEVRQPMTEM
jgi:hypothetical protein